MRLVGPPAWNSTTMPPVPPRPRGRATSRRARVSSRRLVHAVRRFSRSAIAPGLALLAATIAALATANSPFAASFAAFWTATLPGVPDAWAAHATPRFLVNDGLMTLFFLLVGLEIRHETHAGSLSTGRSLVLPLLAAVGGMAAPALL